MPVRTARREASRTSTTQSDASWAEATCQLSGILVPLAFHTLGTVAFESTKVLLVRLLALLLLLGWLGMEAGRIGLTPGPLAWRGVLPTVWYGPLRLTVFGLIAVGVTTALSTATSISPLVSLLGSWDRQQGLVTTLGWMVLGVVAALAGRAASRRRMLPVIWALGSVPVCLYAYVQFAQLDPIAWLNQPLGVTSTLGSSTALATYLAMLAPLTLAGVVLAAVAPADSVGRVAGWRRLLADPRVRYGGLVAVLVAQVAALAMTQVRGGLLALAAALLVMAAFVIWPSHRRLAMVGAGLGLVALVAGSVLLAAVPRPDVGDGEDTSARQRLLVWQDAVQASLGPRLMIGHGPETQILALEPRYPVELALRFEHQRFDRAHNLMLDTILTTGLLGLAALGLLVFAVTRAAILAALDERGPSRWFVGGLLGALTANLVANLFAYDSAATGVLFWMVAGLLVSPLVPVPPAVPPVREPTRRERRAQKPAGGLAPAVRLRATAMLAAGAIGLALVPWITAPFLADLYHTRALALRAGEAPGSSTRQEIAAVQSVPWLDVPVLALGDTYLDLARTSTLTSTVMVSTFQDLYEIAPSSRAALFEATRLTFERAVSMNPRDPYTHAALARYWVTRGEASRDPPEQTDFYGQAVEAYDRAIAAGPSRVSLYDESGVALTRWGKPLLALDRFNQAEALGRPTAERISRRADAQVVQGDRVLARALYEQALLLDQRSAPAEAGLGHLEREAGNVQAALEHAQRAARYQMRNWQYQRDLAVAYRDAGQPAEALAAARAARRIAPAWEQDDLTALIQSVSG